jgi:hypothetical protein
MFAWLSSRARVNQRQQLFLPAVLPVVQQMEPRRLLSTCSVVGDDITVTGDSVADTLTVEVNGSGELVFKDGGSEITSTVVLRSFVQILQFLGK